MWHKFAHIPLICLLALPAPLHASAKSDLAAAQKAVSDSKKRQERLERDEQKLGAELEALQRRLVAAATAIQKADERLQQVERRLEKTVADYAAGEKQVTENKARLETLVVAALGFSKMPVEAMVVMPGDTANRLRVSRALKMLSEDIRVETERLNLQMRELAALEKKLAAERNRLKERKTALERERAAFAQSLTERRSLQDKLQSDRKREAQKAAGLVKKVQDLHDLLEKLTEKEDRARRQDGTGWVSEAARKGKVRSFAAARGHIRMPVAGEVKERFGQVIKGIAGKGVVIGARAYAEVVSPYDGEVIFAGPFLTYGKMVIIKHSDDFHTLLAGLGRIDTQVGEFLLEGEPIGAMGNKQDEPRLYIELRKNSQPVNPAPWMKGI